MSEKEETTKTFPLRTILAIVKAYELGRRGVEITGVRVDPHVREVQLQLWPKMRLNAKQLLTFGRGKMAAKLGELFPQIRDLSLNEVTQSNFEDWMDIQHVELGLHLEVPQLG